MNPEQRRWLCNRAISAAPYEACGFVMENGDIIEIRNVAVNRMRQFRMDCQEMVEKLIDRDDFITAVWHTHPGGNPNPSVKDLESISCGAIQRNWLYLIVTSTGVHPYYPNNYVAEDLSGWHIPDLSFWSRFTA